MLKIFHLPWPSIIRVLRSKFPKKLNMTRRFIARAWLLSAFCPNLMSSFVWHKTWSRSARCWLVSLNLKSCFVLHKMSSRSVRCWLVSLNLKSCFVLHKTSSRSARCWFVSLNLKSCFVLLKTSSRSACCWFVSLNVKSCFALLKTSSPSARCWIVSNHSFLLCFAKTLVLDSLCTLRRCIKQLSKYPYYRTGPCKLLSSLQTDFPPAHVLFPWVF